MNMDLLWFIVCFTLITVCRADFEIPNHLKAHAELLHNYCVKEIGVDEGELAFFKIILIEERIFQGLIKESRNGYLPMDEKLACYIHCLFHKTHMVGENWFFFCILNSTPQSATKFQKN